MYKHKFLGFTLAEVLITLGIIGVVAAMTLPTLIKEQRNKALEVAFKKAYTNISSAFNLTIAEEVPVFTVSIKEDGTHPEVDYNSPFAQSMYKKFRKLKKIGIKEKGTYNASAKNYTKQKTMQVPQCSQYMSGAEAFITPDGSIISIMQNCGALWITTDTNGLIKGPNALGHDILIFRIGRTENRLLPAYTESEVLLDDTGHTVTENGKPVYNNTEETKDKCSLTSASAINGASCGSFAIQDVCPYDETKTYWECLP